MHVDDTHHWDEHHRLHVPLITHHEARVCVAEHFLHLSPHKVWLLNNSVPHGVLNRGPERLHLCLDLPHFDALMPGCHRAMPRAASRTSRRSRS